MKRQRVQTDRPTGILIHYYEDRGPSRARMHLSSAASGLGQVGGSKAPPPVEGYEPKRRLA